MRFAFRALPEDLRTQGSQSDTPGAWRVVGVSVQGSRHRALGLPCQDAQVCHVLPGGELVLVVADGAGSAACSAEGASLAAVQAAVSLAAELGTGCPASYAGWLAAVLRAYRAARAAVGGLAGSASRPLQDFATTLTCAVAAGGWLVTGQLGDGLVVARAGGELLLAARPQRGEYANEAYFLTMDDALEYVEVEATEQPVEALAASTDGLLRLALRLPGYEPHAPFFGPLFGYASHADPARARAGLIDFLDSPRLCARTDDDKTLALAVCRPAAARLAGQAPLALSAASFALDGGAPRPEDALP